VPIEVTMPKLSPTMESGVLSEWKVKVGDAVKEGDVLADVETDKASMPMKSFDDGVVAHLDVGPGDEVALGQRVLVLARKGEDAKAVAESLGKGQAKAPARAGQGAEGAAGKGAGAGSPSQPEHQGTDSNGQGQAGRPAAEPATVAVATGAGGRVKSSPLARKIAASAGIDVAQVPGSGPGGRVIRRDVETFLETRTQAPAAQAPAARPAAAAATRGARRIPHSRMRRTIAQRMLQAKQSAPEIHVTVDIRLDKVVAIREALNKQLAAEKVKLSLGDFVTKAVALALRRHPALNASFEPDAVVEHGEVNIGIAVALEGGLIVPVLRNADVLGLREIRAGSEALAEAARSNKLTTEQLTGGTFTISNLGMYGVRQFDAILNLPEVGILAVGSAEKRPVVVGDHLEVGTVLTVTLTADHRAVDGATAAEFLRTLKGLLEEPASMLL
jgi:pyruvate dehydrogenase E2 component (dihydrolipoamide acetyltransferase)